MRHKAPATTTTQNKAMANNSSREAMLSKEGVLKGNNRVAMVSKNDVICWIPPC